MGELIRSRDWGLSELGLPEQWPVALKSAISSVLNSGTAMHISWGDNLLQFYNDAYTPVLTGGKHPAALGRSVRESYPGNMGLHLAAVSTCCIASSVPTASIDG